MSTTTARGNGPGLSASVIASADEPEFSVRFTPNGSFNTRTVPTNSFRWIGPATLRIGQRGMLVTARVQRLLWFYRTHQYFVPSSVIGTVYREADGLRVEIRSSTRERPFFQCWADDSRSAAAIVALLPTAQTVEVEEAQGRASGRVADLLARAAGRSEVRESPGITRVARVSPFHTAWWTLGAGTIVLAAAVALFLLPRFIAKVELVPVSVAATAEQQAGAAVRISDAELTRAEGEYDRYERSIEGLRTQFATALTALQIGTLQASDFENGLQKWLIPQWESLHFQLATDAPPTGSPRSALHSALDTTIEHWQNALAIYLEGLRDGSASRVLSAFGEMKRAEDAEQSAEDALTRIETAHTDIPAH
ncbi:MAG TPA: hypothetical protein VGM84_09685 [Steroidobacteraceae bacterium]|jgi:hypothetical protein